MKYIYQRILKQYWINFITYVATETNQRVSNAQKIYYSLICFDAKLALKYEWLTLGKLEFSKQQQQRRITNFRRKLFK